MKKITFFMITLAILGWSNRTNAQTQNWQWAKSAGGTDSDGANSVTTDALGNIYVAGDFGSSRIIFGSDTLRNPGASYSTYDIFLTKYAPNGNVLWARRAGGTGADWASSVSTDASGNVYVAGLFIGDSITFGTTTLTNAKAGVSDMFIVKYDGSGNVLWAKRTGGTSADIATSVSTDASGNVYVTGYFYNSTATFGSITLTNAGSDDIFLAKYDALGNVLWAKRAGGINSEEAHSVSTDASGNVYVAGNFHSSSITFGSITLTNVGGDDVFLTKYDALGNVLWAKSAGSGSIISVSISIDASGNVYVAGSMGSSITFGATTLTNAGSFDIFLAKYAANGNVLWAKSAGGKGDDELNSVSTDASGNVYVTGYFDRDIITFGSTTLTNAGYTDIFLAKYTANGNVLWAKSAGGTDIDEANSVTTAPSGNVYVVGKFRSYTITFGSSTLTNASSGYGDIFLASLNGTTGIEEDMSKSGFAIYPNPSNGKLTINMEDVRGQMADVKLAVYNVLGERVYTSIINNSREIGTSLRSASNHQIDLSALPAGIYFLQVNTGEEIVNRKIVKE